MNRISYNQAISQEGDKLTVPADTINLQQKYNSAYSTITKQHQVVVIPRYFINHWLPILGASSAWLVLALRQAGFVSKSGQKEITRSIAVRQLKRWSGLSHGQIWNLMQTDGHLKSFARKVSTSEKKRESDTWAITTTIPLAPHHIYKLNLLFENLPEISKTNIQELLQTIKNSHYHLLSETSQRKDALQETFQTLHELVHFYLGELDVPTSQLCDEITARIIQPTNTIAITHYFLEKWRPMFKSAEAWLIQALRNQIYSSTEVSQFTQIKGGKSQLAKMLGVNVRSVRRWFEFIENNSLSDFIVEAPATKNSKTLNLEVKLLDPIHPDDLEKYRILLDSFRGDKNGQPEGQKWTEEQTKVDKQKDLNGQGIGHNLTRDRTKLDTLIDSNNNKQNNINLKTAVVNIDWPLENILVSNGLASKNINEIQNLSAQNKSKLLAWIIYGYEHLQVNGTGIISPVLFGVSRYKTHEPQEKYRKLVEYGATKILAAMQNPYSQNLPGKYRSIIEKLEKNGFMQILCESNINANIPIQTSNNSIEDSKDVELNWLSLTGDQLWNEVLKTIEINTMENPTSIWFSDHELEVSWSQQLSYELFITHINKHISTLRFRFPQIIIRVRLLTIEFSSNQSAPFVRVVQEIVLD